MEGTAIDGKPK